MLYSRLEPMPTLAKLIANLDVPIGTISRCKLVKWATSRSAGDLKIDPRSISQMAETVDPAEETDENALGIEA